MEPDFFLRIKPVRVLVALSDKSRSWYASLLAKETDTTYAHLVKVLDALAEQELVSFEREGRIKVITITKKGEELAHDFESVLMRLENMDSEKKSVK